MLLFRFFLALQAKYDSYGPLIGLITSPLGLKVVGLFQYD